MVMPSNNGKAVVHYWAGRYAGLLGHLYSPEGFRGPFPWLPYALDNGAFGAFTNGTAWDADAFLALCDRAAAGPQAPRWVVVPDVVGDRAATLARWNEWAPRLRRLYGWPLALAVQDGMTADDARAAGADVVFVGGTTRWKRRMIGHFCARHPRVHVGRINSGRWLWVCAEAGAESCDGTGWFRGDPEQLAGLERFLEHYSAGHRRNPARLPDLFEEMGNAA